MIARQTTLTMKRAQRTRYGVSTHGRERAVVGDRSSPDEHDPLLKLQAVDLGFHLPITSPRREGGMDTRAVNSCTGKQGEGTQMVI